MMYSSINLNAQNIKFEQQLKEGWSIESSAKINSDGVHISQNNFDDTK
jgi:exo-1,4-beta-D-glucosaminidase